MQKLESIYHLVHIGYDKEKQDDFSAKIKKMIETISDKSGVILNFVDEPLYSKEEAEKVQVLMLANTLTTFISYNHVHSLIPSLFNESKNIDFLSKEHPKKVLDLLYKLLDGTWQKLKEPISSFEEFKKKNSLLLLFDLDPTIQKKLNEHDSIITGLMENDFLDILLEMVDHFYGINIYNINITDSLENDDVTNKERKQEIKEYAKKLLGKQRIITSGMKDGEINKIVNGYKFKNGKKSSSILKSVKVNLGEELFGNATGYIDEINSDISIMRGNRFKESFFYTIDEKLFQLDNSTLHIVGGEYYKKCVHSFTQMLYLFGLSKEKIIVDKNISLLSSR